MSADRITTQLRLPVAVKRSVNEYGALVHDSEQAALVRLVLVGLGAEYARLGIKKDPAVTARDLLRIIGATWENDLTDDELQAFGIAQGALDRIAGLRSKESR